MKHKNYFIIILCTLFIFEIIIFPKAFISYTLQGASLFYNSVFPSLFPFLVICNIIINYNGINIYSKLFGTILCSPLKLPRECSISLIISFLCGYPLGAKYAATLYENGTIDKNIFLRLLNIASNPSPLFIVGALGTTMLRSTYLGYILLFSSYCSCIIMGLLLRSGAPTFKLTNKSITPTPQINFGRAMKESVESAITTTFYIAGFIIMFYIITSTIKNNAFFDIVLIKISLYFRIPYTLIQGLIMGVLEITNGCFILSNHPSAITIPLISFIINFSGFSVISQVYSLTYKFGINLKNYVLLKFLQGIVSSFITYIILKISNRNISTFILNFNLYKSTSIAFAIICIILLLPLLLHMLKKLFYIS